MAPTCAAEQKVKDLAAIVEYSHDAIFSQTPDGVILSWNRGAEKMYGYTREEVLGKSFYDFSPDPALDDFSDVLARLH